MSSGIASQLLGLINLRRIGLEGAVVKSIAQNTSFGYRNCRVAASLGRGPDAASPSSVCSTSAPCSLTARRRGSCVA
eukprot:1193257-Prorocentrum_minimum.AAC.13